MDLDEMMRRPAGSFRETSRRWVRRLKGEVRWVEEIPSPFGAASKAARGLSSAVAEGLRYEAWVGKELERVERRLRTGCVWRHGPWLTFEDDEGEGVCQPDFVCEERRLVLETKLSGPTEEGLAQLDLYSGVLAKWWEEGVEKGVSGLPLIRKEVGRVLAVRQWRGRPRECFSDLGALLRDWREAGGSPDRSGADGYVFVLTG